MHVHFSSCLLLLFKLWNSPRFRYTSHSFFSPFFFVCVLFFVLSLMCLTNAVFVKKFVDLSIRFSVFGNVLSCHVSLALSYVCCVWAWLYVFFICTWHGFGYIIHHMRSNRHYMYLFSIFFRINVLLVLSLSYFFISLLSFLMCSTQTLFMYVRRSHRTIHNEQLCVQICTWSIWWAISLDDRHCTHTNYGTRTMCYYCFSLRFFVSTLQCFFRFSVHFHRMIFSTECIFFHTLPLFVWICVCVLCLCQLKCE